jgi:hypothetical protein
MHDRILVLVNLDFLVSKCSNTIIHIILIMKRLIILFSHVF